MKKSSYFILALALVILGCAQFGTRLQSVKLDNDYLEFVIEGDGSAHLMSQGRAPASATDAKKLIQKLQGRWQTECLSSDGRSKRLGYAFENDSYRRESYFYKDSKCTELEKQITTSNVTFFEEKKILKDAGGTKFTSYDTVGLKNMGNPSALKGRFPAYFMYVSPGTTGECEKSMAFPTCEKKQEAHPISIALRLADDQTFYSVQVPLPSEAIPMMLPGCGQHRIGNEMWCYRYKKVLPKMAEHDFMGETGYIPHEFLNGRMPSSTPASEFKQALKTLQGRWETNCFELPRAFVIANVVPSYRKKVYVFGESSHQAEILTYNDSECKDLRQHTVIPDIPYGRYNQAKLEGDNDIRIVTYESLLKGPQYDSGRSMVRYDASASKQEPCEIETLFPNCVKSERWTNTDLYILLGTEGLFSGEYFPPGHKLHGKVANPPCTKPVKHGDRMWCYKFDKILAKEK